MLQVASGRDRIKTDGSLTPQPMHCRADMETPPWRQLVKGEHIQRPAHIPDSLFTQVDTANMADPQLALRTSHWLVQVKSETI